MTGPDPARRNPALPKRFYGVALAAPSGGDYAILLDGKPVRTLAKNPLLLPDKSLADAVAAEWRAQEAFIDPETMPLTRLANLTIDRAGTDRAAWIDEILRYAETDLTCYLAPDHEALGKAQRAAFLPLLQWAESEHGLAFVTTGGILPVAQLSATLARFRALLAEANDGQVAALALMVPLLGSALLAFALWKTRITVDQAIKAARLDEDLHAERWGADAQAVAVWAARENDLRAAAFFLTHN